MSTSSSSSQAYQLDCYDIWWTGAQLTYPWPRDDEMNHVCNYIEDLWFDEAVYDYLTAVQGNVNAVLPGGLAHLLPKLYTVTASGAAYARDHKAWKEEEYGMSTECYMALQDSVQMVEVNEELYEFLTVLHSVYGDITAEPDWVYDGIHPHFDRFRYTITEAGNAWHNGWSDLFYGPPYEVGFDLAIDDEQEDYEASVYGQTNMTQLVPTEGSYRDNRDDRVHRVEPEDFLALLEEVDVSIIPAENSKCCYCWAPLGETDAGMIELRSGERAADNSPIKMPCGHLIGKTCLMQLIDADEHLCPICRKDIVALTAFW